MFETVSFSLRVEGIEWNTRREGEEDILSLGRSLAGRDGTEGGHVFIIRSGIIRRHTRKTLRPSLGRAGRQVPLLFVLIPSFPLCREVVQPSRHHDRKNQGGNWIE